MRLNIPFFCLLLIFNLPGIIQAENQRKLSTFQKYIKQYSALAISHQKQHGIPASITLAQGLLESNAGQSELARKGNNHFGIKCHTGWKGGKVYHNDDRRGECFRKYRHVEESYDDHSAFLTERSRYAPLFKLKMNDYKGWARGLQKCGYATDRAYANKLIKIIEDYELYTFDSDKGRNRKASGSKKQIVAKNKRIESKINGLRYISAGNNDSFEQIAADVGIKAKYLRKFNEVPTDFPLQNGDIVYLELKKRKAAKPYYDHVVQIGESMHSISQKYGIQIKGLYKLNKKKEDYVPVEGDVLKLR